MKQFFFSVASVALMCTYVLSAHAQSAAVTPYIAQNVSPMALNNILNSERVFCYTVEQAPSGYTGYTLNQLALTGYCGQLGPEKSVFVEGFFQTPAHILETTASCQIEPKVMLRFTRGIDSTDVLFSDTCPSITIFYGGTVKAFNASPAQKALATVVSTLSSGKMEFISPALLNELMPNGVILNDEHKTLVNQQKTAQPVRNWVQQQPQQSAPKQPSKVQGWNKLGKK